MKHKQVIELVAETYEEEQFILNRFPDAYWYPSNAQGNTVFYISVENKNDVEKVVDEYNRIKRGE